MSVDQLDDELLKLKKEQFNLRFQRATGQLENTSRVREVRRDIARIKTIAAQKRSGTVPAAAARRPKQKPKLLGSAPRVRSRSRSRGSRCRSARSKASW